MSEDNAWLNIGDRTHSVTSMALQQKGVMMPRHSAYLVYVPQARNVLSYQGKSSRFSLRLSHSRTSRSRTMVSRVKLNLILGSHLWLPESIKRPKTKCSSHLTEKIPDDNVLATPIQQSRSSSDHESPCNNQYRSSVLPDQYR